MKIIVTGGMGFIGSNFIRYRMKKHPEDEIINVDKITYASNPLNLDLNKSRNHKFVRVDIVDYEKMEQVAKDADCIINFAAESHVDNSISSSEEFVRSNIVGTNTLLKIVREKGIRFHHISTDEVFGSLDLNSNKKFNGNSPYNPRNPYSATKASADFLVKASINTYGVRATISNCTNNYGPYQHPEKLIPKTILNALYGKKIPIYGKGDQIRDWIHVIDHCSAISLIIDKGKIGTTYLIGGSEETRNIDIVKKVTQAMNISDDIIEFVSDRPGHDVKYALETSNDLLKLGWKKTIELEDGLRDTVKHYMENKKHYENYNKWQGEWN